MTFSFPQWAIFAATEAESAQSVVPAWVKLLMTAAVFLVPYGLGVLIARQLKLKEYAFKISVVLFAATLGVMPFVYQIILGQWEQRAYDRRLEAWEARQQESPIEPEDIDEIQDKYRRLKISRYEPDGSTPPPEIKSAP